jgi:hypothetical protein
MIGNIAKKLEQEDKQAFDHLRDIIRKDRNDMVELVTSYEKDA